MRTLKMVALCYIVTALGTLTADVASEEHTTHPYKHRDISNTDVIRFVEHTKSEQSQELLCVGSNTQLLPDLKYKLDHAGGWFNADAQWEHEHMPRALALIGIFRKEMYEREKEEHLRQRHHHHHMY